MTPNRLPNPVLDPPTRRLQRLGGGASLHPRNALAVVEPEELKPQKGKASLPARMEAAKAQETGLLRRYLQAKSLQPPGQHPVKPLGIVLETKGAHPSSRPGESHPRATRLLILVKSARAGARVKASLTRVQTPPLKLTVNESKSRVGRTDAGVFLGFTFRGAKLRWSDDAFADFKHHVRQLTGRSWGVSMAYRLERLARYIRGWMNYFGISDSYRPIPELDHWLRHRIRRCDFQQGRRVRTKVRHLLALGTGQRQAILTALSAKGYWHLSKTLATQSGMTNAWLQRQGLISVRDL